METENSGSPSRSSFGDIASAKHDRRAYPPPSSPKPTQESPSSAGGGGGGDAASDGESAGAVETKGARLVRQLRQRAGPGSLALAPAAPCGNRPRQLDTALAQDRVVLQNALAHAVGFVDQARDEIMKWLDRRGAIPRARPSINEIREIKETSTDASPSNPQHAEGDAASEDGDEDEDEDDEEPEGEEGEGKECSAPPNTRVGVLLKDSASDHRNEKTESQGTNNSEHETEECTNIVEEQGPPSKENTSQSRTLKKSASGMNREAPQAKWESNLPRNRISNTLLHTELSICEINAKIRPSIGLDNNRFFKKKSLAEIYGGGGAKKPVRKKPMKVKRQSLGAGSPTFCGNSNATSEFPHPGKANKLCVAPSRQVTTITSGVKKMSLGPTRAAEYSACRSEAAAHRKKLGTPAAGTSRTTGIGSQHKNIPTLPPIHK